MFEFLSSPMGIFFSGVITGAILIGATTVTFIIMDSRKRISKLKQQYFNG